MCLQALAEQQKAQQLAQQQAGAPQAQAAPGQAQAPASGQAQVPQAAAVAGAPAVTNAALLVRLRSWAMCFYVSSYPKQASESFKHTFHVSQAGAIKNATVGTTIQAGMWTHMA